MIRYLRWTLICRRGRRCADVTVIPVDTLPVNLLPAVEYTCEACGTRYQRIGFYPRTRV